MIKKDLRNLKRSKKQILMIVSDTIILMFSIWFSFTLRLGSFWSEMISANFWIFFIIPLISIPLFVQFGLYKSVLKFMGTKVIISTLQAITVTSLTLGFVMMILEKLIFLERLS